MLCERLHLSMQAHRRGYIGLNYHSRPPDHDARRQETLAYVTQTLLCDGRSLHRSALISTCPPFNRLPRNSKKTIYTILYQQVNIHFIYSMAHLLWQVVDVITWFLTPPPPTLPAPQEHFDQPPPSPEAILAATNLTESLSDVPPTADAAVSDGRLSPSREAFLNDIRIPAIASDYGSADGVDSDWETIQQGSPEAESFSWYTPLTSPASDLSTQLPPAPLPAPLTRPSDISASISGSPSLSASISRSLSISSPLFEHPNQPDSQTAALSLSFLAEAAWDALTHDGSDAAMLVLEECIKSCATNHAWRDALLALRDDQARWMLDAIQMVSTPPG